MACQAYYLCDTKDVGRFEFYIDEENSGKYYHKEIKCSEKAIKNGLCAMCLKRYAKLQTYVLSPKNVLKVSLNGVAASHHNVFHRRIGEPIPLWSNAEGGERYKQKIIDGYSMVKTIVDEKAVLEFIHKIKGTIPQKQKQIAEEFKISKNAGLKYIKQYKLSGVAPSTVLPPMVVSREKDEAFDIVEVHLKKIEIGGKSYLYEKEKSKVFTLEYDYVGRYDSKEKKIFTEYPDSDAEPTLN